MDLVNTLSWPFWLVLAALLPALVALYFLKLKRQPLAVPSTYLWRKSVEDLHVNSIWQRLRRNLLLFLQLLLILLAMIALLRPGCRGAVLEGTRLIFVVDNSASMSAADVAPTRLAVAKRQVLALIDEMSTGDQAMVMSFANDAEIVQQFTDNRRTLRQAVESIAPTPRTTSLAAALRLAAGRTGAPRGDEAAEATTPAAATMYVFSDGNFPDVNEVALERLSPILVPIGAESPTNYAVTAFNCRRHESDLDKLQVFAELENFSAAEARLPVELYLDDALIDADEVVVAAGRRRGVAFDLAAVDEGALRLVIKADDSLPLDNVAYQVIDRPRRARVLLATPGNEALELALTTGKAQQLVEVSKIAPAALTTAEYERDAASGRFDLMIFDQCSPPTMPQANTLFIGRAPPESSGWKASAARVPTPQIIDLERAHPLLQLIDLSDVEIAESLTLTPPQGGEVLIDSSAGAIAAIAPRAGFEDAVLGFELVGREADGSTYVNTNWPLRLSFPTFILNAVEYLGGQGRASGGVSVRPGEVVELKPDDDGKSFQVRLPDGELLAAPVNRNGLIQFAGTTQLGVYTLEQPRHPPRQFAVNLLDSRESRLAPRERPASVDGAPLAEKKGGIEGRRETWKWWLAAGLAVLLGEWYIYNRRVYL